MDSDNESISDDPLDMGPGSNNIDRISVRRSLSPSPSPTKAKATRKHTSRRDRIVMASQSQFDSTRHQNGAATTAKNIIDDLVQKVERTERKFESLVKETAALRAERDDFSTKLVSITEERDNLRKEKNIVNEDCSQQRRYKDKYLKQLNEGRRKTAALEKTLIPAKKMASIGPRTTFKTFIEAQEQFSKAVEEGEKTSSET